MFGRSEEAQALSDTLMVLCFIVWLVGVACGIGGTLGVQWLNRHDIKVVEVKK